MVVDRFERFSEDGRSDVPLVRPKEVGENDDEM